MTRASVISTQHFRNSNALLDAFSHMSLKGRLRRGDLIAAILVRMVGIIMLVLVLARAVMCITEARGE